MVWSKSQGRGQRARGQEGGGQGGRRSEGKEGRRRRVEGAEAYIRKRVTALCFSVFGSQFGSVFGNHSVSDSTWRQVARQ